MPTSERAEPIPTAPWAREPGHPPQRFASAPISLARLLADGQARNAATLAAHLQVDTAVLAACLDQAEREYGLDLVRDTAGGYRLRAPLELLDAATIHAALPADGVPSALEIQDEVDSTNAWLLRAAARGAPDGACCLAEYQHAGRGRQGRAWVSPFGANLYLSLLWRAAGGPATFGRLSLAAGVAIVQALDDCGARDLALKWPNDIHWRQRKLAGLLLEVGGAASGPSHAVLGVGVNLRLTPTQARAIDQPWTDLQQVMSGTPPGRNRLAAALIARLLAMRARYLADGLAPFLDAWRRWDGYRGGAVVLSNGRERFAGHALGIDDTGALLFAQPGQDVARIQAGELSLRGVGETLSEELDSGI